MCIYYSKDLNEKIIDRQGTIVNNQKQGSGNQNSAQSRLQATDVEIVEYFFRRWPGLSSAHIGL